MYMCVPCEAMDGPKSSITSHPLIKKGGLCSRPSDFPPLFITTFLRHLSINVFAITFDVSTITSDGITAFAPATPLLTPSITSQSLASCTNGQHLHMTHTGLGCDFIKAQPDHHLQIQLLLPISSMESTWLEVVPSSFYCLLLSPFSPFSRAFSTCIAPPTELTNHRHSHLSSFL